jgi:hypothetical protein
MKCIILENISITTNIKSLSFLDLSNPKTKSMNISTQGSLGTGKGVYKLWGMAFDLVGLHVIHLSYIL